MYDEMEEGLNLRQKRILHTINSEKEGRLSRNKIRDKIIDGNDANPKSKMSHQTFQNELNKLVDSGYLEKFEKLQGKTRFVIYSLPSAQNHDESQILKFINSLDSVRENIQILKDKSWKHSFLKTHYSLDNSLPNYQHLCDLVREYYPNSDLKSVYLIAEDLFPKGHNHKHHVQQIQKAFEDEVLEAQVIPISVKDMEIVECNNEKRLVYYVLSRIISFMMILEGLFKRMSERNRYSKEFIKLEPFFDEIQKEYESLISKYGLDLALIEESLLESTTKSTGLLLRNPAKSFKNFNIYLPHENADDIFGLGVYSSVKTHLLKLKNL